MIKALTWNVWFGGHRYDERVPALLETIGQADADLIALQEVMPEFLNELVAAPWSGGYKFSDRTGRTLGDYGVVILSRLPVTRFDFVQLPTVMGRKLLVADVDAGGTPLTFATVQLESMESAETRARQLGLIFPALANRAPDCLLVGDMNFEPDAVLENGMLDPTFTDVWPALHPDDPGYTVDSQVNRMRWQVKQKLTRKRIDRVFLRGTLAPSAIDLVGATPHAGDEELFPSDHFGLRVTLDR
jgi:tyrosyl-DNA phosphodiesterase 2